jgi:hypothetical protein
VVVVEQQHALPALREVDRQREPDRPRADNDDAVPGR